MRRHSVTGAWAAVLLLAACTPGEEPAAEAAWPTTDAPVSGTAVVWADGGVVHVGPETWRAPGLAEYVVAGTGVWFLDGDDALHVGDDDGIHPTGFVPMRGTLLASPDGRFVGFIHRPDERPAEAVVLDTTAGTEIVRSRASLGDEDDDLSALYEDDPPYLDGLDSEHAWVDGADGTRVFDLAEAGDGDAGDGELYDDPALGPPTVDLAAAPTGGWRIVDAGQGLPTTVTDGAAEVTFTSPTGRLELVDWADADTVVGWSHVGDVGVVHLTACTLSARECEVMPAGVLLPNGSSYPTPVVRR